MLTTPLNIAVFFFAFLFVIQTFDLGTNNIVYFIFGSLSTCLLIILSAAFICMNDGLETSFDDRKKLAAIIEYFFKDIKVILKEKKRQNNRLINNVNIGPRKRFTFRDTYRPLPEENNEILTDSQKKSYRRPITDTLIKVDKEPESHNCEKHSGGYVKLSSFGTPVTPSAYTGVTNTRQSLNDVAKNLVSEREEDLKKMENKFRNTRLHLLPEGESHTQKRLKELEKELEKIKLGIKAQFS
ncbi:hypothetical protein OAG24_00820 [bacterium]|nr:hypothetical protein [bacterium]